jgi:Cytochrome P460
MTTLRLAAAATTAGAVLLLAGASLAGPEKVAFPADYTKTFKRYAEVDLVQRKVVRYYFSQPAKLKAAKPGQPAPDGTVILMEDHKAKLGPDGNPMLDKDGKFIPEPEILAVIIQEKEKGWGADYPADKRNGEWEYAIFNPDGKLKDGVKYDACFGCHKGSRASRDYTFTFAKYVLDHPNAKTR